jgi:hypothetical protein
LPMLSAVNMVGVMGIWYVMLLKLARFVPSS